MKTTEITDTRDIYEDPDIRKMAQTSAIVEATGYLRWTRVEETIEFARRMGFQRLGLAFCVGLHREAAMLSQILRANGLEVVSAACKTGAIQKEENGLSDDKKVRPGTPEVMCNPVAQAKLMNASGTELNVIVGLCVGHDSLFIKFSEAPVTCLVAKDRVLAHNPVGAIYCGQGYYRRALFQEHKIGSESAPANPPAEASSGGGPAS
jgi:uncharacterized metal-binding protein